MTFSAPSPGDGTPRQENGELRGTIHGVVSPHGSYVNPGRRWWTRRVIFWLTAWRLDGEPVRVRQILVVHEVPLGTVRLWRRRMASGAAVTFVCAGIQPGSVPDNPRMLVDRFLEPSPDPELLAEAAAFLRPDSRTTAEFGTLVSEPGGEGDGYVGRCAWHGPMVTLDLSAEEPGEIDRSLELARALHAGWEQWEAQLLALIDRELLPMWRDWHADEAPIDAATLYRRFTLESIWVAANGQVQLTFDAGEQFTDHEIMLHGTVEGGPTDIFPDG